MDFSDGTTKQLVDPATKPIPSPYEEYAQSIAGDIKGGFFNNLFRGEPNTREIFEMVNSAGKKEKATPEVINLIYSRILHLLQRGGGKSKVRRNRKRRTRRRKA